MENDCDLASGKLISQAIGQDNMIKERKHVSDRVLVDYKGGYSSSNCFHNLKIEVLLKQIFSAGLVFTGIRRLNGGKAEKAVDGDNAIAKKV